MIMMVVVMIVIMVMVVIMIVVMLMVGVMSYEGGHDTRQADRIMGMVVAVPGLSRGWSRIERHSSETSCGGNGEGHDSFTEHETPPLTNKQRGFPAPNQ